MGETATGKQQPAEIVLPDAADAQGMDLLAAHVPLSLLIDLVDEHGPASARILETEQPDEEELAWLTAGR